MITIDDKYMEQMFKKDPEFKKGYDALGDQYNLIKTFMRMRAACDMTQEEIAKKMGTSPGALSRFLRCNVMPNMNTILRYAKATGFKVTLNCEKLNKPLS